MAVPATLFFAVQRIAGADANDLLDWMNGVEANRSELRELVSVYSSDAKSASEALRADLRREVAELRDEMHQEFAAVRAEMQSEFAAVRDEMRAGFASVDVRFSEHKALMSEQGREYANQLTRYFAWSVGIWVTTTLGLASLILAQR